MSDTVMIVAGETSGELYGSLLAFSLRKRMPHIKIVGIGGERMKEAGVHLISGITSSFGITEVLSSLRAVNEAFHRAKTALESFKPHVLVLIDYPDFNLKLAKEAQKKNIKILYYVSPQVWAWRKGRVKKITRLVDRMAVVLPFEEEIYTKAGLPCEFVGHPVLDEMRELKMDAGAIKRELGLKDNLPLLSLMPGSRPHELDRLLPVILAVVHECKQEFKDLQYCVPFAPNTELAKYSHHINMLREHGVVINKGESLKVISASDCAVITSGTASLQAAFLGLPFVVIYKLFPLTYWLGKFIVNVRYISLVNILSGRAVVREFIQTRATTENIKGEIREIMTNADYRENMLKEFRDIKDAFSEKRASEKVAGMVLEMAGWER